MGSRRSPGGRRKVIDLNAASSVISIAVLLAVCAAATGPARAAAPDLEWADTYGDTLRDVGYWIEEHSSYGYLVAGYADFDLDGVYMPYLMRLDSAGDTLWMKTYGDTMQGGATFLESPAAGVYILAGFTVNPLGNSDALFIRTDSSGDTLWTSTFDFGEDEHIYRVLPTPDNGFIAAGFTSSLASPGSTDVLVLKLDEDGHGEWKTVCGGPGHNRAYDMCMASDGNYVLTGYSEVGSDIGDLLIMKIDADSGDSLWAKTYGDTTRDMGRSLRPAGDGGFIVAGGIYDYDLVRMYGYLVRTDADGDTLWTKVHGDTSDYTSFRSMDLTSDGGFVCAGYIDTAMNGDTDCYYLKADTDGNIQWTKAVGKDRREAVLCVTTTSDGGYASAGYGRVMTGIDFDIFLVKLGEDEAGVIPVGGLPAPEILSVEGANPFTSSVAVRFEMPDAAHVRIAVYDVEGRLVTVLEDAVRGTGSHRTVWNLNNTSGSPVPSGVYFIRCAAAGLSGVEKVIVLK